MYAGGEGVGDEGVDDDEDEEMDDEAVVNGVMQMKISEIKAELDMREVSYAGLTTKVTNACLKTGSSSWVHFYVRCYL